MKKLSYNVKLLDGNRLDFETEDTSVRDTLRERSLSGDFLVIKFDNVKKYINMMNIVSVTEHEVNN